MVAIIYLISIALLTSRGVTASDVTGDKPSVDKSGRLFHPRTCGDSLLLDSSGWFTSPRYPKKYRGNSFCEWIIHVQQEHVIEITFHDFELGDNDDLDDYVLIYEEAKDESEESPVQYFDGSLKLNPNMSVTYRSKSNHVIIQFASGTNNNFKGFNASYRSWDIYCDKNSLADDGSVDVSFTFCNKGSNRTGFYKQCFVWCNGSYIFSSPSSKVVCEKGSFQPKHVCDLIPYKVTKCEETNLKNCSYSSEQLADYWRRKEPLFDPDAEGIDLDLFPDIVQQRRRSFAGARNLRISLGIRCFDDLIGYSYCTKNRKKKHAFSCKAFTKIKKLKPEIGENKMNICFKCRAISCTATVYL